MKKTLFLLIVIALSFGAYAQESFSAMSSDMATDGIVRGDETNTEIVSYCKYNGRGRFILADASGIYGYHAVDTSWNILDFRIVYGTVIFCGTVTKTGFDTIDIQTGQQINQVYYTVGLIGFFGLQELKNPFVNYYAIDDTPVHIPPFLHLIEEVTDDPNYYNATIAQHNHS